MLVQSKKWWCRHAPARSHRPRPVPPEFVGLCFNCLANDHVHANYTFRSRCYLCHSTQHRTRNCKRRLPANGTASTRDQESPRHRLRRPDGYISSSSTVSGRSYSTGRETSVPRICAPDSPRGPPPPRDTSPARTPPPTPPPPPPPGHASMRPRSELLIIPRTPP
jgi:hypothetical protein